MLLSALCGQQLPEDARTQLGGKRKFARIRAQIALVHAQTHLQCGGTVIANNGRAAMRSNQACSFEYCGRGIHRWPSPDGVDTEVLQVSSLLMTVSKLPRPLRFVGSNKKLPTCSS